MPAESQRSLSPPWRFLPFAFAIVLTGFFFGVATDPVMWSWFSRWFSYLAWPVFGDMGVTLDHFRQADDGIDPLLDPESAFAYPRAVLALRYLGLHHIPLPVLGTLQAAAAMIGIFLVLRPKAIKRSLATACLLLTPPLMLGFERANLDFALFLLCAIAARQWSRVNGHHGLSWPIAGMVVGALLKLYPVFAILGAALAERGRRRALWLLSAAAVFGYWAWNAEEMGLIAQKIPVATSASWGCLIVFARLERFLGGDPAAFIWLSSVKWPLVALLTYGAGLLLAVGVGRWLSRRMKSASWMPREWCYYWTGAAICCGSFAGANFAYRWIFVILTLPLLIRFAYQPDRWVALWARFTVVMLIVSLISPLSAGRWVFLVTQAANWACILSLVAGAVALRLVSHHPSRAPIRPIDPVSRQRDYPPAFPPLGFPEGAPAGRTASEQA